MKQIPIDLQEHYDGYATTTCHLIRIRNKDALIFALTDADHDIAYDAAPRGTGQPGDNYGLLNHLSDNGGASLSKTEAAADLSETTEGERAHGDQLTTYNSISAVPVVPPVPLTLAV